jgi:hypothetical protein
MISPRGWVLDCSTVAGSSKGTSARIVGSLALLALCGSLLSCRTTPTTAVRLEVLVGDVDLAADSITLLRVRTYDWAAADGRTISEAKIPLAGPSSFPVSLAIVPRNPASPSMSLGIDVDALRSDADPIPAIHACVQTAFRPGEIVVVRVVLSQACVDHAGCSSGQTCDNGQCVTSVKDPASLPVWNHENTEPDAADTGADATDTGTTEPDVLDATTPDASGMDVAGPPPDVPPTRYSCSMPPEAVGYYCPLDQMCVPPLPGQSSPRCCRVMLSPSCSGVACPPGQACWIDPMGHPACCEAASPTP